METHDEINFAEVGEGLLECARQADFSPRGKVSELFPYIWEASRRLSTRAISRYLAESHGIKLSAVSVAKAIRNPEKHWEEFADFIEPQARLVSDAYGIEVEDILFQEEVFDHLEELVPVVDGAEGLDELDEARAFISNRWYSLSEAARGSCHRYLSPKGEESEEEGSAID